MLPYHLIRLCSVVVFVFVVILVVFTRRIFAVVIVIHVFPFVQAVLGRILVPEKSKEESNALWTRVEKNSHLIIHYPTSEGVSKVSERAKRAGRSKQKSEKCE